MDSTSVGHGRHGVAMSAISRRQLFRTSSYWGLGTVGSAVFAACNGAKPVAEKVPVEKSVLGVQTPEALVGKRETQVPVEPVEKVTARIFIEPPVVEKVVQAVPQRVTVVIRLANDHSSGSRGDSMKWALEKFAAEKPHISIRFEPQNHDYREPFSLHAAAGTSADVAMLDGGFFNSWVHRGGFTAISEALTTFEAWNPSRWYAPPDEMSVGQFDDDRFSHKSPHATGYQGVMFGMPYQGNINGAIYNFTLMEEKGIPAPIEGKHHLENEAWDLFRKGTDPEAGTYGLQMHPNPWIVWASWARGTQTSGNHMYRAPDQLTWDLFNDGGDRGFELAIRTLRNEQVAVPLDEIKTVAGAFSDPFSAGKQVRHWTSGGLGDLTRDVGSRFEWGLGPMEEGDNGPHPHHFTNQGHYCMAEATTNGVVEECTETLLFLAGERVQGRIATDRGSLPMLKTVVASDEFKAGPPANHGYYKTWMDKEDHHHWQNGHPGWWEWYEAFRAADSAFAGDVSADEGMSRVIDTSDRALKNSYEDYVRWRNWVEALST